MLTLFGGAKFVLTVLLRLANETSIATMKLHIALNLEKRGTREKGTSESSLQYSETLYSYLHTTQLSVRGTPTVHYHPSEAEELTVELSDLHKNFSGAIGDT